MNKGEKIEYMIKCLEIAKEEYDYSAQYIAEKPDYNTNSEEWRTFYNIKRTPNRSLIADNLRNVARMGFLLANEVQK